MAKDETALIEEELVYTKKKFNNVVEKDPLEAKRIAEAELNFIISEIQKIPYYPKYRAEEIKDEIQELINTANKKLEELRKEKEEEEFLQKIRGDMSLEEKFQLLEEAPTYKYRIGVAKNILKELRGKGKKEDLIRLLIRLLGPKDGLYRVDIGADILNSLNQYNLTEQEETEVAMKVGQLVGEGVEEIPLHEEGGVLYKDAFTGEHISVGELKELRELREKIKNYANEEFIRHKKEEKDWETLLSIAIRDPLLGEEGIDYSIKCGKAAIDILVEEGNVYELHKLITGAEKCEYRIMPNVLEYARQKIPEAIKRRLA